MAVAGKSVGLNLKELLKFKPWGAVNLAKGVNGALAAFGLALELWDTYQRIQKEEEFRKGVETMVENFKKQKKEILDLLDGENFIKQFFPELMALYQQCQNVSNEQESLQGAQNKFHSF